MKTFLILLSSLFVITFSNAQDNENEAVKDSLYEKYREDQFYIGATYNLLNYKPSGLSQRGFSGGVHFGFLRDIPINEKRTFAIALGVGLSLNSYNQNLGIIKDDNDDIILDVINNDEVDVSKNTFYTNLIEVPLEFRWRTSTTTSYKFWRVYTGFKFGYVFSNGSNFESDLGDFNLKNSDVFEKVRYGLTLSTGYNTWNFHVYYGLNGFFTDQQMIGSSEARLSEIKVGLMFYLL